MHETKIHEELTFMFGGTDSRLLCPLFPDFGLGLEVDETERVMFKNIRFSSSIPWQVV
jgi:hypothetical protein